MSDSSSFSTGPAEPTGPDLPPRPFTRVLQVVAVLSLAAVVASSLLSDRASVDAARAARDAAAAARVSSQNARDTIANREETADAIRCVSVLEADVEEALARSFLAGVDLTGVDPAVLRDLRIRPLDVELDVLAAALDRLGDVVESCHLDDGTSTTPP